MSVFNYFSLSSNDVSRIIANVPSNATVSSSINEEGRYDVTITLTDIVYQDSELLDIV